jgi:hypothetical protein
VNACLFVAHSIDGPDASVLCHAHNRGGFAMAQAHILNKVQRHEDLFVFLAV